MFCKIIIPLKINYKKFKKINNKCVDVLMFTKLKDIIN